MQNAECRMLNVEGVHECRNILHSTFNIHHSTFNIQHSAFNILHSVIKEQPSLTSRRHPSSCTEVSIFLLPPSSLILPPSLPSPHPDLSSVSCAVPAPRSERFPKDAQNESLTSKTALVYPGGRCC